MDSGGANGYFTAYWGLQRESKNSAIFVAPEWNGGGWTQGDIAFTDDMVKTISTNYCVDMSDIITSGFSFGGGMSHALACSRANPGRIRPAMPSERRCCSKHAAFSSMGAAQTTTPSRSGKRPA